jgi:hypothetical protein
MTMARWFIETLGPSEQILVPSDEEGRAVSIEDIRDICSTSSRTTFDGGYRLICIPSIESATPSACNALLKILEEPPDKTIFLLCAVHEQSVMATIRSRCVPIRFLLVPSGHIRDGLVSRGCGDAESAHYANESAGIPGLAIRLMEDPEYRDACRALTGDLCSYEDKPLWHRSLPDAMPDPAALVECVEHYLHDRIRARLHSGAQSEGDTARDRFCINLMRQIVSLKSAPILLSSKSFIFRLFTF